MTERAPGAGIPLATPLYKELERRMRETLAAGEWKPGRGDPRRAPPLRALRRLHRHGAQGDRRAGRREHPDPPAGPRHVRRHAQPRPAAVLLLPHRAGRRAQAVPGGARCSRSTAARAERDEAEALGIAAGDAVIRVRNVLSLDGAPVIVDDIVLPAALFPGLTRESSSPARPSRSTTSTRPLRHQRAAHRRAPARRARRRRSPRRCSASPAARRCSRSAASRSPTATSRSSCASRA